MVDDIHFPKGLPPVPASGRVQGVNRKKRDDEKPPFEKYLNQKDSKEKKKNRKKNASETADFTDKADTSESPDSTEDATPTDSTEAQSDSDQKIIDVHA